MAPYLQDGFGGSLTIGGCAVPWNSDAADGRNTVFAATSFTDLLNKHGGRLPVTVDLVNHSGTFAIFNRANSDVRFWPGAHGLMFAITDIQASELTSWAATMVLSGAINKCSHGHLSFARTHHRQDGVEVVDSVASIDHVALVDDPAYTKTHVAALGADFIGWQHGLHATWEAEAASSRSHWVKKVTPPAPRAAPRPNTKTTRPRKKARPVATPNLDAAEQHLDRVVAALAEARR